MPVTVDNRKHSVDELSALFDEIDISSNLDKSSEDYGSSPTAENIRPFESKIADIKSVMEHTPQTVTPPKVEETKQIKQESPDNNPDKVSELILPKIEVQPVVKKIKEVVKEVVKEDDLPFDKDEEDLSKMQEEEDLPVTDLTNPLGLIGNDLQAYKRISEKYPQFTLTDGKQAFKEFYRWKLRVLKSLLTSFPVLDLKDMIKESSSINMKYQIEGDLPDPNFIGIKLAECQIARGRLTALIMSAQVQLPLWKKDYELLSSKLWKDHESRGSHKRDALVLEHMHDMHEYYNQLEGFISSSTILDSFLKSTHDSLSRQLACVSLRDNPGNRGQEEVKILVKETTSKSDNTLDNLDTLEHGTVIHKQKGGLAIAQKSFSGPIDEFLDDIG